MVGLSDLFVGASESLRTAMQRMTRNRLGVLFVSDDLVRVRGVLSDGDVRRTLLEDTLLLSPVEKVMNPNPVLASSIEEAEEMLGAEDLVAVPVVDREGALSALVVAQGDRFTVLRGTPAGEPDWTKLVARGDAIAVIPARGGSKRIPDKNLQRIGGETLVGLAVKAALGVDRVSAALVSTDSRDIAEAGIAAGGVAPWLRPAELARDDTPTIDVVVHAARWAVDQLESRPSYVLLLEPTAPMRRPIHIQRAIELLDSTDVDAVVSVVELPHVFHPDEVLKVRDGRLHPFLGESDMSSRRLRGIQEPAYIPSGLVYGVRTNVLLEDRTLFGRKTLAMAEEWADFVDIDEPEDLERARAMWKDRGGLGPVGGDKSASTV